VVGMRQETAQAMISEEAVAILRATLAAPRPGLVRLIEGGPTVFARFQPIFKPHHLKHLTREEFQSFLVQRNNLHWSGLHRKGPKICSNMGRLRKSLAILLDEARPIAQRLDALQAGGRSDVPGMGRAILTAILLVVYPDRYGVWNNRSQASMEALGLWPQFERGESLASRYVKVNNVMLEVARQLGVDLWTLDGLWWAAFAEGGRGNASGTDPAIAEISEDMDTDGQPFGLERHLHDFLLDNWEKTALGREWTLVVEDGETIGYEYPTAVGRIDLLARHRSRRAWLVVELKRNQSSDDTVGQVLRYMGYVRDHVAVDGDEVMGLIISHAGDDRIHYALRMVPNVSLMLYEVDFRLKPEKNSSGALGSGLAMTHRAG